VTPDQARKILARDPLQHFTPTPTQEQFLRRSVDDWAALIASVNRGGKSTIACVDLALLLRGIHPHRPNHRNITVIQFTPSRLQAANVIGLKLFKKSELFLPNAPAGLSDMPMIPKWEIAKLNEPNVGGMKVPYECIMKNGNRLLFSWSGVDGVAKRISGLKIDAAYIDENSGTQALFDEMYPRLLDAQSDPTRPGLGFFVWPNTNVTYNEAYSAFVERVDRGVAGHRVFTIGKHENPAISQEKREALKDVLSVDAARIRMDGDVTAGELVGIYTKQWDDLRHVMTREYEVHHTDNLWIGYDPGVDHPMGMMVCAIGRENPMRLHVVKCWNSRGETIEHDANNLREWLRGRRIAGFVYDTNLKNRDRGGGPSVLARLKDLLADRGIIPHAGYYQSKKNHAPGIALCRHYLDPNPDDRTIPPLLVLSKPTDANGTGILRQQILKYRGKEATRFTGAGGVVKKDDELIDAWRYVAMQRPCWTQEWVCGRTVDIPITSVAFLDTTGTVRAIPMHAPSVTTPQFDCNRRVFTTRMRGSPRGSWRETSI